MKCFFWKRSRELTHISAGVALLTLTAWMQICSDHLRLCLVAPQQCQFFRLRLKNQQQTLLLPFTFCSIPPGSCFTPAEALAIYIAEVLMCLIPQFLNLN